MARTPLRIPISFRLAPDLLEWVDGYRREGEERTALIEGLLVALRERRLIVTAESAPTEVFDGRDPSRAVLVSVHPKSNEE